MPPRFKPFSYSLANQGMRNTNRNITNNSIGQGGPWRRTPLKPDFETSPSPGGGMGSLLDNKFISPGISILDDFTSPIGPGFQPDQDPVGIISNPTGEGTYLNPPNQSFNPFPERPRGKPIGDTSVINPPQELPYTPDFGPGGSIIGDDGLSDSLIDSEMNTINPWQPDYEPGFDSFGNWAQDYFQNLYSNFNQAPGVGFEEFMQDYLQGYNFQYGQQGPAFPWSSMPSQEEFQQWLDTMSPEQMYEFQQMYQSQYPGQGQDFTFEDWFSQQYGGQSMEDVMGSDWLQQLYDEHLTGMVDTDITGETGQISPGMEGEVIPGWTSTPDIVDTDITGEAGPSGGMEGEFGAETDLDWIIDTPGIGGGGNAPSIPGGGTGGYSGTEHGFGGGYPDPWAYFTNRDSQPSTAGKAAKKLYYPGTSGGFASTGSGIGGSTLEDLLKKIQG